MIRNLVKVLGIAATLVELVVVVLVVDELCWFIPYSLRHRGAGEIQSKCAKVKVGMSRDEAIRVMHKDYTPAAEGEGRTSAGSIKELRFWGARGTCTVRIDESAGLVAKVEFDDRWDPIE